VRGGPARALELLQLAGAGVDHLLPSPDLPDHVAIAGIRGAFADEAAEHAILMMLALTRRLPELLDRQRRREWAQRPVAKLAGRTVLVLGLGEIGRRVAARASALGMRVLGVRRASAPVAHVDRSDPCEQVGELEALLPEAEHVVVTVPLTRATRHLLDARTLALLPRGALIVHLSRGGVIDEAALLEALRSGALGGAALDVFEHEPLPPDSPFWDAPNTIVTPHVAGYGERYLETAVAALLENVRRLEAGEPLVGVIDRDAGY
jgi:phosphoglycerate dehydrogenase-like enzyme